MDSEILDNEKVKCVLDKMRSRCAVREYCSSDVADKVRELLRGEDLTWQDETVVDAVLATLKDEGFLSDERYAVAFARDKAYLTGWGEVKIRLALLSKNIDESTVKAALEKVDESAVRNQLERLLQKKLKSLLSSRSGSSASDMEIRSKLTRFGLGRGYSYDNVNFTVDRIMKNRSKKP